MDHNICRVSSSGEEWRRRQRFGKSVERSFDSDAIKKNKKSRKKLILLIDDCPDALEVNRIILELEGYDVASAQSGSEGLALLFDIRRPDLILLDVTMQEMSGLDFLKALEGRKPDILADVPIVFFSGIETAPPSAASGFIRKPAPVHKFLTEVRYYVDRGGERGRYKH